MTTQARRPWPELPELDEDPFVALPYRCERCRCPPGRGCCDPDGRCDCVDQDDPDYGF